MASGFFILLRFFLRVDGVVVRLYDTRIHHQVRGERGEGDKGTEGGSGDGRWGGRMRGDEDEWGEGLGGRDTLLRLLP